MKVVPRSNSCQKQSLLRKKNAILLLVDLQVLRALPYTESRSRHLCLAIPSHCCPKSRFLQTLWEEESVSSRMPAWLSWFVDFQRVGQGETLRGFFLIRHSRVLLGKGRRERYSFKLVFYESVFLIRKRLFPRVLITFRNFKVRLISFLFI